MSYSALLAQVYRYFFERNLVVDFVEPGADLGSYALVVAPTLYLLEKKDAQNLDSYVRKGGTLLVTSFSGIVDENERVVPGGYPAYLRETLGLCVEEWFPLGPGETRKVKLSGHKIPLAARRWSEVIHAESAEVLATFGEGHLKGSPAFTGNDPGKGHALYLGTQFDDADLAVILDGICNELALKSPFDAPPGVEITLREKGNKRFLFLLNHNQQTVSVPLCGHSGRELLSAKIASKTWPLSANGVAVIELTNHISLPYENHR